MFGYVKVFLNELKVIEQKHYKAIYCGLCKTLGKDYGQFSRLTLSYDFTFLALFELATTETQIEMKNEACIANPFLKKPILKTNKSLQYSADSAILMVYYKIIDDIHDSKLFKKISMLLLKPFFYFAKAKARKRIPDIDDFIKDAMHQQFTIEKQNCDNIDEAAMPTAKALGFIFENLSKNKEEKTIYNYFGYSLGKWVYYMDAADDYFKDIKENSYNVLANVYGENLSMEALKEIAMPILNTVKSDIINAYNLITIKRYKSLMDNILFLGLKYEQYNIFNENSKENTSELEAYI